MNRLARTSTERSLPHATSEVTARIAAPADRDFVMSLVPRLVASGLPPWRDPRKMLAAYTHVIGSILRPEGVQSRPQGVQSRPEGVQGHAPRSDAVLLIADDEHAVPRGFILLVAATDCYTHERHGHVAQIVVADPQDLAAGLALIAAAEEWTRSRGYRLLTLGEFWANHPARALCQRLGFAEEIVKYRKVVR